MALIRTGGNNGAEIFKKWVIIGSNSSSSGNVAVTYANAENVTPTYVAVVSAYPPTPFDDSDIITFSIATGTTNVTITAKADCYVYAVDNTNSGAPELVTAGQSITRTLIRLAVYAIEK